MSLMFRFCAADFWIMFDADMLSWVVMGEEILINRDVLF